MPLDGQGPKALSRCDAGVSACDPCESASAQLRLKPFAVTMLVVVSFSLRVLMLSLSIVALIGCARITKPDLERLYASTTETPGQPPVVIIPGLMGTRLEDAEGRELWVGSRQRALWSRYDDLALQIDPQTLRPDPAGIRPTTITDQFADRQPLLSGQSAALSTASRVTLDVGQPELGVKQAEAARPQRPCALAAQSL